MTRDAPSFRLLTARALRRTLQGDIDAFPQDVIEKMKLLLETDEEPKWYNYAC